MSFPWQPEHCTCPGGWHGGWPINLDAWRNCPARRILTDEEIEQQIRADREERHLENPELGADEE